MLFLALSANILSGKTVVSREDIPSIKDKIRFIFDVQGFKSRTTSLPWEDYLNKGQGNTPMVWAYEAQFINYAAVYGTRRGNDTMVMLYPEPGIWSNHVFMSFSEKGNRLLEALLQDPQLQKKFNEYGFRSNYQQGNYFLSYFGQKGVTLPASFDEVASLPDYQTMLELLELFK